MNRKRTHLVISLGVFASLAGVLVSTSVASAGKVPPKTSVGACESMFVSSGTAGKKNNKTEAPLVSTERPLKPIPESAIEIINGIQSGSPTFRVIVGKPGQKTEAGESAGLYGRHQRSWKPILEGEVWQADSKGNLLVRQIATSKVDGVSQILLVVDGSVYLLSVESDMKKSKTFIRFGSEETPLIEAGTGQRRFLQALPSGGKIAIHQDFGVSSSGAQLILVSVKFERPESVGDGLTFAVEVLPVEANGALKLNGNPTVIDYKFHTKEQLENLVSQHHNKDKIVYSEILIRQFENSDLSRFSSQIDDVRKLVMGYVNAALRAVRPGAYLAGATSVVGYNTSQGKVVRDVEFEKEVHHDGSYTFYQNYFAKDKPILRIEPDFSANFDLEGLLDFLPNGKPAVWRSSINESLVFMKDGRLHALFIDENGSEKPVLADLGTPSELFHLPKAHDFPVELVHYIVPPKTDGKLENALVLLSVKTKSGAKFTSAVRLNYYLNGLVNVDVAFKLLNFHLSMEELMARTDLVTGDEALFDNLTPATKSVSAYKQAYDPSRPHVNLIRTAARAVVHEFKHPRRAIEFAPGLNYAHFSLTPGVVDPSGLYARVDAKKISGNETIDRELGEIIRNPFLKKDEVTNEESRKKKDDFENEKLRIWDYVLAEINAPRVDATTDRSPETDSTSSDRIFLFAVDAGRKKGTAGFRLVVAVPDAQHQYTLQSLVHLPREMMGSISNFKGATFIRGRKRYQSVVYLLLSFRRPGDKVQEATYSYRIDFTPKGFETNLSKVDDVALTTSDIAKRLGYTEEGVPALALTPNLSPEAHKFAMYDLQESGEVFPNQNYNGKNKHQGIRFGDFKGDFAAFQNLLSPTDSWEVSQNEMKNRYKTLGRSRELAEFDSFVDLGRRLDEMANSKSEPSRMILVVPEALRDLVWDFVLSRALIEKSPDAAKDRFNLNNPDLNLQIVDERRDSQVQYLSNLDMFSKMRRTDPQTRNFVLARTDEMSVTFSKEGETGVERDTERKLEDPTDETEVEKTVDVVTAPDKTSKIFKIREIGAGGVGDLSPMATKRHDRPPHPLYLLAAGKPLSLKEFRDEKPKSDASIFVLATPEEMRQLKEEAALEVENGMLEAFRVQEIKDPDHASMSASIGNIFLHPDVKSLGFKFSADLIKQGQRLDSNQSFHVVTDYAISRFSHFVVEKKTPLFESFMRFRSAFANAVLSDKGARRSRVIDKHFVERVLTQVFDIPMNLQTLPEDDPMRILSNQNALLKWQEAGYTGPFDLKAAMRDTIVSQTRANAGKPIPSSIVLFGNTGAGKTYAFKTLIKMLNLKVYDFNSKDNSEAQAMIINVGQILEKGGQDREGSLDIEQVIKHLEKFLASPNGYRGWILIDDVHAAKDSVKAQMVSWLRGIFESQDGMFRLGTSGVRRPVRNLNFFMTLNPTADQDQIAKYAKNKANPTSEEILLATLSTSEFKVEPSFLRRWGRIVNLDYMPAGAKGPELINSLAKDANSLLNTHSRIALVDPEVVNSLVQNNAKVDARTFLTASTNSLIETAADGNGRSALVMVVPSTPRGIPIKGGGYSSDENPAQGISQWVRLNTRTLALDSGAEGNLTFLKMVVDAFRVPVYENLVLALQEDPRFSGDAVVQKNLLSPILTAIVHHIQARSFMSVKDLEISARNDFKLNTASEREALRQLMDRMSDPKEKPLYPPEFRGFESDAASWQNILADHATGGAKTRRDVLAESVAENRRVLMSRLAQLLYVQDLSQMPPADVWLTQLPNQSTFDPKIAGRELAENLWQYLAKIFANEVNFGQATALNTYSATRLYLYSVDRSIVQLPWGDTSRFLLKSLEFVTRDQVLSQKPGVQGFLFKDRQRLIKPTITDFVFQIVASSHAIEEIPKETAEKLRREFERDLGTLLK